MEILKGSLMRNRFENISSDIIEDSLSGTFEGNQSNEQIDGFILPPKLTPKRNYLLSTSSILENNDILFQENVATSIDLIDTNNSKKYRITLSQVRMRALRSIKRARNRNQSFLNDND